MSTKCPKCGGTGKLIASIEARNMRVSRKLTLAKVAKAMGISVQYLSDLETGKRDWDTELEHIFRSALKEARG